MGVIEGLNAAINHDYSALAKLVHSVALFGLVDRAGLPWLIGVNNTRATVDAVINATSGYIGKPFQACRSVPNDLFSIKPHTLRCTVDIVTDFIVIKCHRRLEITSLPNIHSRITIDGLDSAKNNPISQVFLLVLAIGVRAW